MKASTNLALRPFRNERLPWLLAGVLFVGATLLSLVHARFVSSLLSRDEAGAVRTVREDEARIADLEARLTREPPVEVSASERARLRAIKELVDRRVFPWRRLLSELEATLSEDVRLTRISPAGGQVTGGMLIELAGEARTKDAAFSLAEALDALPVFSKAALKSLAENEGLVDFELEVVFDSGPPAGSRSADASLPPSLPASPVRASPAPERFP
jgi:hypothetical protein